MGLLFCGDKARAQAALGEGWSGVFPGADISWMIGAAQQFADIAH